MGEPKADTNICDPRLWRRFWQLALPYFSSGKNGGPGACLATETTRLESFDSAPDAMAGDNGAPVIESQVEARLTLDRVTLQTPDYRKTLVRGAGRSLGFRSAYSSCP